MTVAKSSAPYADSLELPIAASERAVKPIPTPRDQAATSATARTNRIRNSCRATSNAPRTLMPAPSSVAFSSPVLVQGQARHQRRTGLNATTM